MGEMPENKGGNSTVIMMMGMMMMMQFVVMVGLVVGGIWYVSNRQASPPVPPVPAPVVVVDGVFQALAGHPEDAQKVAGVFRELAHVMSNDSELVKTTADVRQAVSLAGRLVYGDSLKGKYPGFGAAVNKIIEDAIGDKTVRNLTDADRRNVITAFSEIANQAARVQ